MTSAGEQRVVLVNDKGEDLIDTHGRIVTLPKLAAHVQGRRHRAVSVFIFSSRGELMLQQRAASKYHCSGLWSNTCCTHPKPHEIPADAARRRLIEEMGINCPLEEIFTFTYSADVGKGLIENEFDHVFFGFTDTHPATNPDEAADWRWHPVNDLGRDLASSPEQYAPWLRYCFPTVMEEYNKCRAQLTWNSAKLNGKDPVFDYLHVDAFIKSMVDARSLLTAFDLGIIDYLVSEQHATSYTLQEQIKISGTAMRLLLNLLASNGVIEEFERGIKLTRQFADALKYRDLLELKLVISQLAAHDLMNFFNEFISRPEEFMKKSRFLRLFNYSMCFDTRPESHRMTKRWMRITTTLTKYEAQVCMKYHDFSRYQHMLDIGGNSGEFGLKICRKYSHMMATVFDLPVVCDIGMEHIGPEPEADRITFIKGNALTDVLPYGFDLITFKSMLHDWPENEAWHLISKAQQVLKPGGTLLIFERGPLEVGETTIPYSMIPFLIFFHSYHSPKIYEKRLEDLGFQDIRTQRIELEMPFYLITGRKT